MTARRVVAVRPAAAFERHRRLFAGLEREYAVRFTDEPGVPCEAAIVTDGAPPPQGVPALVFERSRGSHEAVTFADTAAVDRRLRRIVLSPHDLGAPLEVGDGDTVLAGAAGDAAWVRGPGPVPVDRLRVAPPALASEEVLRDALLQPQRALGMVAVVDLLRRLTTGIGHEPPPVRAVLLFDDPNLRWRSYGYIDYRRLVQHAAQHNYHAAVAMIPLDARRPHATASSLFRHHPERLSVVIHGNNHERLELMQPADVGDALELGAQALRRVARFQAAYGVRVGPIMVPPHGMCSRTMLRALGALPFDALCAAHPLPWTETPPPGELLAGWQPAWFVEGCAVIQRLPFGSTAADIALRAYAGHPVVLYGHHEDVAGGLDVLADAAARVNRLGNVQWTSLEEIACGNTSVCREARHASLRMHARLVRIPEYAQTISVASPDEGAATCGWSFTGEREIRPFDAPVQVARGATHLRLRNRLERDPAHVSPPRPRIWPHLRRIATESRDRLLPVRP